MSNGRSRNCIDEEFAKVANLGRTLGCQSGQNKKFCLLVNTSYSGKLRVLPTDFLRVSVFVGASVGSLANTAKFLAFTMFSTGLLGLLPKAMVRKLPHWEIWLVAEYHE